MKICQTILSVSTMPRGLLVALLAPLMAQAAGPGDALAAYRNIPLWDAGQVPAATGTGPLDAPFLTVFPPRAGKANGGAVIVAPGGGNIMLMYGGEGMDIVANSHSHDRLSAHVLLPRRASFQLSALWR